MAKRQIKCASAVDGQIGYVVDGIVICVHYHEADSWRSILARALHLSLNLIFI